MKLLHTPLFLLCLAASSAWPAICNEKLTEGHRGDLKLMPAQGTAAVSSKKVQSLMQDFRFMACLVDASTFGFPEIDRIPSQTASLVVDQLRMDRVLRSVFVSLDGEMLYLANRGGLQDQQLWYGPVRIADFKAGCEATAAER